MTDAPRYATLRDYVRVVRARRLLIFAITAVLVVAAVAISASQDPRYAAESRLSFRISNEDSGLVEPSAAPATFDARPAINAEIVAQPELAMDVRRRIGTDLTVDQLRSSITARVDARTNLLVITGTGSSGRLAADVTNGYARALRDRVANSQRRRYAVAAESLRRRLRAFGRPSDDNERFARTVLRQRIATLESLRDIAQPIQVVRAAEPPSAPVSPRPVRNGILGLILGLTLGLLAAFVRDSFDRRLRGSEDVTARLGLPVVGHVTDSALGRSPAHPDPKLTLSPLDLEGFRILRQNVDFLRVDDPPRSLLVTSGLPEEGKTTVSLALASVYAMSGQSTLLIECDLRRPVLSSRMGFDGAPGLTDYLAGQAEPAAILRQVEVRQQAASANGDGASPTSGTLVCIPAGRQVPLPAEMLASERFRTLLHDVGQVYDMVILDTPPLLSVVDTRQLVPHVDGVLLCVRSHRTTDGEASAAKTALDVFPEQSIGLVITGLRSGDESSFGYYSYAYGYERVAT